MTDTDCDKCRQPLQISEGRYGDTNTLCWACQSEELACLRARLANEEANFDKWWAAQVATLPLSRPKLARAAFLAGLRAGRRSPEVAEE